MRYVSLCFLAVILTACVNGPIEHGDTLNRDVALYGSKTYEKTCLSRSSTVWVEVEDRAECIKFYASGMDQNTDTAIIYLHGDIGRVYYISAKVVSIDSGYKNINENFMTRVAIANANRANKPFIFLGRPGTFGSSGDHGQRLRKINIQIINAAIDKIKTKYNLGRISLVGQSGGGSVVSGLLNWRNDIKCAVLASSAGSRLETMRSHNLAANMDRFKQYVYDPIDDIHLMPKSTSRKILVLADQEDTRVKNWVQKSYLNYVKKAGHDAFFLPFKADDSKNHNLGKYGVQAASACMDNKTLDEIHNFAQKTAADSVYDVTSNTK